MNNEHEQLSIKFNNLQNALELTLAQNQRLNKDSGVGTTESSKLPIAISDEMRNLQQSHHAKFDPSWDTEKNLISVFEYYRSRLGLMEKIEMQNRKLKEKLQEIDDFKSPKAAHDNKEVEKKDAQIAQLTRQLNDITSKYESQNFDLSNKDKVIASRAH